MQKYRSDLIASTFAGEELTRKGEGAIILAKLHGRGASGLAVPEAKKGGKGSPSDCFVA
jgi:hypothetical protein